jgi:hypothetical protein
LRLYALLDRHRHPARAFTLRLSYLIWRAFSAQIVIRADWDFILFYYFFCFYFCVITRIRCTGDVASFLSSLSFFSFFVKEKQTGVLNRSGVRPPEPYK